MKSTGNVSYAAYYYMGGEICASTKMYKRLSSVIDNIITDQVFTTKSYEIHICKFTEPSKEELATPRSVLSMKPMVLAVYLPEESRMPNPKPTYINPLCTEKERLTLAPKSATMDKRKE